MKILDILGMGFRNLLRRKTRTLLTVVGVVVGATAIVIMLSLGIGMEEQLNNTISSMGDLTIIDLVARPWRPDSDGGGGGTSGENHLDDALIERIREWDGVVAVSPYEFLWRMRPGIYAGRRYQYDGWATLIGVSADFVPYLGFEIESGQMPQPGDTNFMLIGRVESYKFRDTRRPLRQREWEAFQNPDTTQPPRIDILRQDIYIQAYQQSHSWNWETGETIERRAITHKQHSIDKIGILKPDDSRGWDETTWMILIDYNIIRELQIEEERANRTRASQSQIGMFDQIKIKTADLKAAEAIMLRLEEEGLMLSWSLSDVREGLQETQRASQMLLGGIGAISLLVAAIGIANTMFMSIYERTKEIGVMKVLGCPLNGIQSMFLFEASIIGFCGGIFGSALSIALSMTMNRVEFIRTALGNMGGTSGWHMPNVEQSDISIIPLWLIIAAIVFSTLVGLVSGYLPSRRATKISALEAIRNE